MTIKKFIDLKFKTKYTSPKKKLAQQQKLPIVKLSKKKKKKSQSTNFIQNKQPYTLKNF